MRHSLFVTVLTLLIFIISAAGRLQGQDPVVISGKVVKQSYNEGIVISPGKNNQSILIQWHKITFLKVRKNYNVLKSAADGAVKGTAMGAAAGWITKEDVGRTAPLGALVGVVLKLFKISGEKIMGWDETVLYDKNVSANQELLKLYPLENKKVDVIMQVNNGAEIK